MKKINLAITVEQVNSILPQTQCTLCDYNGCKPYAKAIVENGEEINRCPPGGIRGLLKLAALTGQDATPYLEDMELKQKPKMIAVIREDECIGCTKCIQACPVDAIMGASKLMHTIITDECSGCELCVEPCPVDCIDMVNLGMPESNENANTKTALKYRTRYEFREQRLLKEKKYSKQKHLAAKNAYVENKTQTVNEKKRFIAEALARVQAKRSGNE